MIRHPALVLTLAVGLFCAGCGDEMSRGIVINTATGKMGANNAPNERETVQDTLRIAIEDDLGAGWVVKVAITELPITAQEWMTDASAWKWERMTARVSVTPPAGGSLSDTKRADLEAGSRSYLAKKLVQPKDASLLALTVEAVAPSPVVAAVTTVAPVPAGPRTYVLQAGDTLADISTAFYGSPQHWRALLAANPGLDPAGLHPGQTIVIPQLAAPAPSPVQTPAPAPEPAKP